MSEPRLHQLLVELEANLRGPSALSTEDRALLERIQADLEKALRATPARPASHTLRQSVRDTIERLQVEHPKLSGLLSSALDALSDLGV